MNTTTTIIYVVALLGIFYFMLIRPQNKQRKERGDMLSKIKVGDDIYTIGGILGEVTRIKDKTIWLRVSDKVEIEVLKTSIGGLQGTGESR